MFYTSLAGRGAVSVASHHGTPIWDAPAAMRCSLLQCVAVSCSVLQCVAVCHTPMCVRGRVCALSLSHTYTHIHTPVHTFSLIHSTPLYTTTHTLSLSHTHTYTHTYTHPLLHTLSHTHIYTQTYPYTHILSHTQHTRLVSLFVNNRAFNDNAAPPPSRLFYAGLLLQGGTDP